MGPLDARSSASSLQLLSSAERLFGDMKLELVAMADVDVVVAVVVDVVVVASRRKAWWRCCGLK